MKRRFLRILGWSLIITWLLGSVPTLLIAVPARLEEAPLAGVGYLLSYLLYLALGVWLVTRKRKLV